MRNNQIVTPTHLHTSTNELADSIRGYCRAAIWTPTTEGKIKHHLAGNAKYCRAGIWAPILWGGGNIRDRAHNHLRRTTAACDEPFHWHWQRDGPRPNCNVHGIGNATYHGRIATYTAVAGMRVELERRCITLLIYKSHTPSTRDGYSATWLGYIEFKKLQSLSGLTIFKIL